MAWPRHGISCPAHHQHRANFAWGQRQILSDGTNSQHPFNRRNQRFSPKQPLARKLLSSLRPAMGLSGTSLSDDNQRHAQRGNLLRLTCKHVGVSGHGRAIFRYNFRTDDNRIWNQHPHLVPDARQLRCDHLPGSQLGRRRPYPRADHHPDPATDGGGPCRLFRERVAGADGTPDRRPFGHPDSGSFRNTDRGVFARSGQELCDIRPCRVFRQPVFAFRL